MTTTIKSESKFKRAPELTFQDYLGALPEGNKIIYVLNLFLLRYVVNPVLWTHIKEYKDSLIKTVKLIALNEVFKLR